MPPTTGPTTAKISWVDGALLVAEGGSGHTITMDGAPDVGGRNLASRPMVVVLMVADRPDDHPKVFTSVKLVFTVRGRKLNRALIERAVSLSDEKYCSATAMIRKSANISHEVVLVEV